tara:strand:+ start:112987 stop:113544 length:558 start_codon:yes stop_codon:yes gene_type:complete
MQPDRRQFLKSSGIVLAVTVGGEILRLSPREAQAADLPYQVLSQEEVATLAALAEAIVPGARDAGITQFIDKQLAADDENCLLMLKYLGVPLNDFTGFYRSGLQSAAQLAQTRFSRPWSALAADEAGQLLADMNSNDKIEWQGPPAAFFFFVLRSDACDVVYGTEDGFARIGVPYMAHIAPIKAW